MDVSHMQKSISIPQIFEYHFEVLEHKSINLGHFLVYPWEKLYWFVAPINVYPYAKTNHNWMDPRYISIKCLGPGDEINIFFAVEYFSIFTVSFCI